MRIFQLTECDFYVGPTAEACVKAYRADTIGSDETEAVGIEAREVDELLAEFGEPVEIIGEALDQMKITYVDEPGHPTKTFREALSEVPEGDAVPFASTEY